MMVKKYFNNYWLAKSMLLFVVFFMLGFRTIPQGDIPNRDKIIEAIGEQKFNASMTKNPGYILFLSQLELDGYKVISDVPSEKLRASGMVLELPLRSSGKMVSATDVGKEVKGGDFNVLKYGFELKKDTRVTYALGSSGVVLQFLSIEEITRKVNANN